MTSRDLTAGMLTGIAAGTVRPIIFYEGEFPLAGSPSGVQYLRLFTGLGTISWDGHTWTGGGHMISISPIEESADIKAVGFTVMISGLPSENIERAVSSVQQGLAGKLWLGLLDAAGSLIADPYLLRRGKFDVSVIESDGQTCSIAAQYEDRLVDLEKPRGRRYTPEDQRLDYPNDLGFAYVTSMQDISINWS